MYAIRSYYGARRRGGAAADVVGARPAASGAARGNGRRGDRRGADGGPGPEGLLRGGAIDDGDVRRLLHESGTETDDQARSLIHAIPVGYKVDGENGIRDVRAGTLNMAEAINAFTEDEYCTLF